MLWPFSLAFGHALFKCSYNQLGSSLPVQFPKLTLDHAPFLPLGISDRGIRQSRTLQGPTTRRVTLSTQNKFIQLNRAQTHRSPVARGGLRQQRLLLQPQQTAQANCESLLLPFRTVIGGPALGSWGPRPIVLKSLPSSTSSVKRSQTVLRDEQSIQASHQRLERGWWTAPRRSLEQLLWLLCQLLQGQEKADV